MNQGRLIVDVLHHLTRHFRDHAILKGGMELALFSSPRSTNDLDFIFVPFQSKKDIVEDVKKCLEAMAPDVKVSTQVSSKNAKFVVQHGVSAIEVEINVATDVESIAMNTAVLAKPFAITPQIIRVMKPEVAFAHKIGTWNERRLIRDLYDIYFWFSIQKILPDAKTLALRLQKVESRIPRLRRRKSMTIKELGEDLREFSAQLDQSMIDQELPSIVRSEREEFSLVLKSQINLLVHQLEIKGY